MAALMVQNSPSLVWPIVVGGDKAVKVRNLANSKLKNYHTAFILTDIPDSYPLYG